MENPHTIPDARARAIPVSRIPVSVWTVFMGILCRKRFAIITPVKAERIPTPMRGHCPVPMGLAVLAARNRAA